MLTLLRFATSTFQLTRFPITVMVAVPLAGDGAAARVGISLAPLSVALKISTSDGIPVELSSLHATPSSATAANTVNVRDTCIPFLLTELITGEIAQSLRTKLVPPFEPLRLLDDDFS